MNELQNFDFEGNKVRTVLIDDEPYFVGKDVAEILGYKRQVKAINDHVEPEDKREDIVNISQSSQSGRAELTLLITEAGIYDLIFNSQLDSARRFKRWVTSEVLPTIRKHGMYATEELLNNPDLLIQVATQLKEERTGRLLAEQQVQELKPKATYYDLILQNKSLLSVSKISKDYGMSARAMNTKLHELGVQFKQGDIWLLYAKYQDRGYTQTSTYALDEEHSKVSTKWTQAGRLFIYELLKSEGILPVIERGDVA